ncbi:nucleoside-diphosphate kinase [Streptomyces sp. NPDC059104]|uniref:nucleoside-diphosphate kinase n=1 Tax=Streptomyces sp. NPDC059104 TaxID=3346729 RepID=UPI0036C797B2
MPASTPPPTLGGPSTTRTPRPGPERVRPWQSAMFSVIAPDAVRRHLARPILERLRASGLRVVGWCPAEITPVHLDGLYEQQLVSSTHAYRYRALDTRYRLGTSIALRLAPSEPDPGPIEDWYRRLKTIKGPSHPADATPGCIRYDFGAVNTVLSLLHASDDPELAARESSMLLADRAGGEPSWRSPDRLDGYLCLLESTRGREERGFPEVLSELRARLVTELWEPLGSEGQAEAVRLAADGRLSDPETGGRLGAFLPRHLSGGRYAALLSARFDPEAPPLDIAWVQRVMSGIGAPLDDWSSAVLGTSMFFSPRTAGLPALPGGSDGRP